jgi:hypothetical protein
MPKNGTKSADTTPEGRVNLILANEGVFTTILFAEYLDARSLLEFSVTCRAAKNISSKTMKKNLLTAVVSGNEDLARKIVKFHPELLRDASASATDLSGKEIKNLTPLQAAICAGDIDMVQMIKEVLLQKLHRGIKLSFVPTLEIQRQLTTIYPEGIDANETAQMSTAQAFKTSTLVTILNTINAATDLQVAFELDTPGQHTDSPLNASLHNFRAQFAATANQEQIFNPFYLLKAFEFYDEQFDNFNGNANEQWNRRFIFWCQIIGYIQRHLPACYLQAFAQGIYYINENDEKLKRDFEFKFDKGFHMRAIAGDLNKLGYKYAAGLRAAPREASRVYIVRRPRAVTRAFSKFIANKKIRLGDFTQQESQWRQLHSYRPTRCVIT